MGMFMLAALFLPKGTLVLPCAALLASTALQEAPAARHYIRSIVMTHHCLQRQPGLCLLAVQSA